MTPPSNRVDVFTRSVIAFFHLRYFFVNEQAGLNRIPNRGFFCPPLADLSRRLHKDNKKPAESKILPVFCLCHHYEAMTTVKERFRFNQARKQSDRAEPATLFLPLMSYARQPLALTSSISMSLPVSASLPHSILMSQRSRPFCLNRS